MHSRLGQTLPDEHGRSGMSGEGLQQSALSKREHRVKLVDKLGETFLESQSILIDTAVESDLVDNLEERSADGLLSLQISNHSQHLTNVLSIGGLVAAQYRVESQSNRVSQVVIIVLDQLYKDKLKNGSEEGEQRLDDLLILLGLNRSLKS